MKDEEKLQLDFISFIRFPLIIGVVLIHAWISKVNGINLFDFHYFHGTPIVSQSLYPVYTVVAHLFSQIIPRISVPLFFFISGFLFFFKIEEFSKTLYVQKIRRRIRSLFVPYVFWNILAVSIYVIKNELSGESYDLTFTDFCMAFWNFKGMYTPACVPFWFIRDLMVLVVLSPLIYLAVKVFKFYVILALSACWLSLFWIHIFELNCLSVYFFTLGAYAGIHHINFVSWSKKYSKVAGLLYFFSTVGIILFKHCDWSVYLLNINVLVGIVCCINGITYLLERKSCKPSHFLESCTFFVFAFHIILLDLMVGFIGKEALPQSEMVLIVTYFAIPTVAILISVLIYSVLQGCFPRMASLITGGRM